jgi:hypothetical protein
MKKSLAILAAVGVASAASAQSWEFAVSEPVLSPGTPSTTVTLSVDHDPGDFAFAAANFDVHASEAGWSDLVAILSLGAPPSGGQPGQATGVISGGDVTGASVGQLAAFGWVPTPGRIDVWRGTFTATDFAAARTVDLSTETTRFEAYTTLGPPAVREARTATEGSGQISIIPAPASLALLGLGGLAAARRRR